VTRPEGTVGPGRPFRGAMTATIVVLALICGVLAGVTVLRGPRLEDAQVDSAALVEQSGQLRLFANERVSQVPADRVRVVPAADFTVSTADEVIAVQFDAPLDYATRYSVTITGITSVYDDRESTFEYGFTTEDASPLHLDRADPATEPGGPDRIVRTNLKGGLPSVVYSAPGIQTFATVGSALAVAGLGEDGTSGISLVDPDQPGIEERLLMPMAGSIGTMASGELTGYLLFTISPSEGPPDRDLLYQVDLTGDHLPTPVLGLDGQAVDAAEWRLTPQGDRVVVRTRDGSLLLVDLAGGTTPTPLGEYASLTSVSLDGTAVTVGDLYGAVALSLEDGSERRLQNTPVNGATPYGGDLQLLSGTPVAVSDGDSALLPRVQKIASYNPSTGRFDSSVVYDDGSTSRVLFASTDQQDAIESFSVSPNGLYAAVTVTPDLSSSVSDGNAADPEATSVTTYVIDVRTGGQVGIISGFDIDW
jgi:hypothetical protein